MRLSPRYKKRHIYIYIYKSIYIYIYRHHWHHCCTSKNGNTDFFQRKLKLGECSRFVSSDRNWFLSKFHFGTLPNSQHVSSPLWRHRFPSQRSTLLSKHISLSPSFFSHHQKLDQDSGEFWKWTGKLDECGCTQETRLKDLSTFHARASLQR